MQTSEEIKNAVKESYTKVVSGEKDKSQGCCSPSCCGGEEKAVDDMDYSKLKGYNPDADYNLGCGLPTEFAQIKEGDTVVDLGSGAGNDVFVARAVTGESGRVIGIDFTEAMIEKAKLNNEKLGYKNVEFRLGDIENLPLDSNTADVIISNCVLNLVPDKKKAFAEIYRTLKPGGHFSVSDIVVNGELPEKIRKAAAMYAGCISGAVSQDEYLKVIKNAGFVNVNVQKETPYIVHDSLMLDYITPGELKQFKASGTKIVSINVHAEKS
jgi:SAM-dependent methyltransferase